MCSNTHNSESVRLLEAFEYRVFVESSVSYRKKYDLSQWICYSGSGSKELDTGRRRTSGNCTAFGDSCRKRAVRWRDRQNASDREDRNNKVWKRNREENKIENES